MKKILIFNPFGIGDVLFTTPMIRNLKTALKNTSISYICNRRVYPLLANNTYLDKVLVFEKDEWRAAARASKLKFLKKLFSFLNEIKKEKFDVVFDLSLNAQYGFFFMLAGIKMRIGHDFKKRGKFLTHKLPLPDGYSLKHVARHYLELLGFMDIRPIEYAFDLFTDAQTLEKAGEIVRSHAFSENGLVVGVCPGSGDSWRQTAYFKRWPQSYFLELCRMLQKELRAKIILFGSADENPLCEYIAGGLNSPALNLCGQLDLKEFTNFVSLCELLITNDGGPFHIAQALGKKTVVFFGPVDERVYGAYPDAGSVTVLTSSISCRPCYKRFKFPACTLDKKCLRDIPVEKVFLIVKNILKESTHSSATIVGNG
jgi:lipopolysaccharide heptosyltransferase II